MFWRKLLSNTLFLSLARRSSGCQADSEALGSQNNIVESVENRPGRSGLRMTDPQFRNSTVRVHHKHGGCSEAYYETSSIVLLGPPHEDPGGVVLNEKSVAH